VIDERCLGPDVDRSKIANDAEVCGSSYLTGSRTAVGSGAVVRDSRLDDAIIESGAMVCDSIIIAQHPGHSHKCDSAGRCVVKGADWPSVGRGAKVAGCTLIDTAIGSRTIVRDTWMQDCRFGEDCSITTAKIIITNGEHHVTVAGPTEISEAYLGHHTTIDRRGYLEGIFSNKFHQLTFDASAGKLKVTGTIDLPHVSKYGVNSINSTNSGKLLPQPGGVFKGFGTQAGLWVDRILSHEQIELAPCCWVVPWTKVIGQSPLPHTSDDELVNDDLTTYVMPFSLSGYHGDLTRGLVMPGELSVGLGPKQRQGGWVFTYAPDAVFKMVQRLYAALEDDRKQLADTIVVESIKTAIEITKAMAYKNSVDLSIPHDQQRPGYPRWIGNSHALLTAHLESGVWQFSSAQAVGWQKQDGKWTHPNFAKVLAIAPDALENQKSEDELFAFADPVEPAKMALPAGSVKGTAGPAEIHPSAKVAKDAIIAPGSRIGAGVTIESGVTIWNSVLENCTIAAGTSVQRSVIIGGGVGAGSVVRSCSMEATTVGEASNLQCASMKNSSLARLATVSPFADVVNTHTSYGTILGGAFHNVNIDTYLMSMHMAGSCKNMQAVPTTVNVKGQAVQVPAIPMLGGGSVIRGTVDQPVVMECSFIGSNAIIEPNSYLGLGCFILGVLGPNAGLLPFTMSTDSDPKHHMIGTVASSLASTVITHFVGWTYNAVGADLAEAVGQMVKTGLAEGIAAIQYEQARRAGSQDAQQGGRFAKYLCLPVYTDEQLQAGLAMYHRSLDGGAWDMACAGGELNFESVKGLWNEKNGSAMWKAK
jgi:carbonic anhydrase/acetyltransferase-like protein (isoleucine patch superfamily)